MRRSPGSFGLSVSTQLTILLSTLAVLLMTQSAATRRFADAVARGVEAGTPLADLSQQASNVSALTMAVTLIAVFLLCPLAVVVVRRFSIRLEDITGKMLAISRNDTNVQIPAIHDRDELGDMARAVHVFKANAVSLLESQELIEQLNVRFNAALNNMALGLSMFDKDQRLVVCNKQFLDMYEYDEQSCQPGVTLRELVDHRAQRENLDDSQRENYIDRWHARHTEILSKRSTEDIAFQMSNGRTISITYEPMCDGGCVAIHEDVTDKHRRDEKINRLARHDSLTGVANRFHFRESLDHHFEHSATTGGFAVHLIDLDRFKDVNDTLGHAAGDVLLRLAAARVQKSMRSGDVIARLGGDEFAVIQVGVTNKCDALKAAQRLIQILSAPFQIQGQSVLIGASIGIVQVPADVNTPDEVIQKADIALYRAKDDGRGTAVLFRPELETVLRSRHQLGVDLRHAIREKQFELHYQPIVGLHSERVTCCEALMRWKHPLRGWVSPVEFIPVAEDLGLICLLGEWALQQACMDASRWPDDVKVAVNLSPAQFQACNLVQVTTQALEAAQIKPERLELEVTESLKLREDPQTCATLHELRALGVAIALDDFGTGYASLSYLLAFPFDKIKIDRMFVRDMVEQGQPAAIVNAIVKLAQSLKISTVAEGVETPAQLGEVTRLGCNEVQGFLFSRPVCADDIPALLSQDFVRGAKAA